MSAPVDEFDLDIRVGEPRVRIEVGMAAGVTQLEPCTEVGCPTAATGCCTHRVCTGSRYC
ncbi:hypothetical protein NONI108955_24735 [Nocardia ninae]|uniref:FxLD family lantipeptide n=1 Tax=Nocardia suismassiliense TaxID=2077092 RepID=A0ABW6QX21_9NOCA|nr:hypothetical protein [Nocardia ninae]